MSSGSIRNICLLSSSVLVLAATPIAIRAQAMQFPGAASPVIVASATAKQQNGGVPSSVVDSNTGHTFIPQYDASGRLASLNSTTGRNAFNLRAVTYTTDGRLMAISFGNRYQINFRYRGDGTQEIVDSLGAVVVRSKMSSGLYAIQSANDPDGRLAPSLLRLKTLFLLFGQTPEL